MSDRMDRRNGGGDRGDGGEADEKSGKQVGQKRASPSKLPKRKTPLGQLPDSLDEVNMTTTDHDTDVARSIGGLAAMPAVHPGQYGQISFDAKPAASSMGGARLIPPPPVSMMQFDPNKAPQTTTTTPTTSAPTGHWNIADSDVKTLPDFHPLDRCAVFVPNCTDASDVAGRVSDVLRSRSISVEYINSKAKAKCMTTDNVDFRIRLYRGKNKFSHGVIVEVQRRYGFSTTFPSDCAAILDAAEGKVVAPPPPHGLEAALPPPPPLPSLVPDEEDVVNQDGQQDSGLESVKIASAMLTSPDTTVDCRAMGLQGLASLTDSYKIGKATATRASAEILAGSNDEAAAARDHVLSLVLRTGSGPEASASYDSCKLDGTTDADQANKSILRTLAMNVLSNVLTNMSGRDELRTLKPVLSQAILPTLLKDIGNSSTNPRTADLAARSLLPVVQTFDGDFLESDLIAHGAYELLVDAQAVGEARYDSLREQSAMCLRALDAVR